MSRGLLDLDPAATLSVFVSMPYRKETQGHAHHRYRNAENGVPRTFLFTPNLTPSLLSNIRFSSSVIPSPSLRHLPLNPPSAPPVATTRWHGTCGANGFLRSALPTARGDEPRCAASSPYVVTWPRGTWQSAVHTRFSKAVRLE